jgi:endonuclease/exonuclease/phosphatase family metal-dependent hydrolase
LTSPHSRFRSAIEGLARGFRDRVAKIGWRLRAAAHPTIHTLGHQRPRTAVDPDPGLIVVLTANLWHDWPRHRELPARLEAFAQLVEREQADVVLVQEVLRRPECRVDEQLADRLQMNYVYSRANGNEEAIGFEEGVAVFSRYPILGSRLRRLTAGRDLFVRRVALGAEIDTPLGPVWSFSAHLSLRRQRNRDQVAALTDWVDLVSRGTPALIGGDFNAHESTPQMSIARSRWTDAFRLVHPDADGTTHTLGGLRRRRLDYLFLRQASSAWQIIDSKLVDAPGGITHSDHRAVVATLVPQASLAS